MLVLFVVSACDGIVSPDEVQRERSGLTSSVVGHSTTTFEFGPAGVIEAWGDLSDAPDGDTFVAVAAGETHNLALREDGTLEAWGADDAGVVTDTPTDAGFVAIAAGSGHSLALRDDGTIEAWGDDESGQVSFTPERDDVVAVAAGLGHSLALYADGTVEAWGSDWSGQVSGTPDDDNFVAISTSWGHNLALRDDGTIAGWGGEGMGINYGQATPPQGDNFVDVAAGYSHSLALREDGSIHAWGDDLHGMVSDAPEGTGFVAISAAIWHSLALHEDGSISAWGGLDQHGEVSDTPDGDGFTAVDAGGNNSLALGGAPLLVDIDIRPGGSATGINANRRGVLPVAVLSGTDFDAPNDVDRPSLTFGSTGDEASLHLRGQGVPNCTVQDVNANGLDDLVCRFHAETAGFQETDSEGILRGETIDGRILEGSDGVQVRTPGGSRVARR